MPRCWCVQHTRDLVEISWIPHSCYAIQCYTYYTRSKYATLALHGAPCAGVKSWRNTHQNHWTPSSKNKKGLFDPQTPDAQVCRGQSEQSGSWRKPGAGVRKRAEKKKKCVYYFTGASNKKPPRSICCAQMYFGRIVRSVSVIASLQRILCKQSPIVVFFLVLLSFTSHMGTNTSLVCAGTFFRCLGEWIPPFLQQTTLTDICQNLRDSSWR